MGRRPGGRERISVNGNGLAREGESCRGGSASPGRNKGLSSSNGTQSDGRAASNDLELSALLNYLLPETLDGPSTMSVRPAATPREVPVGCGESWLAFGQEFEAASPLCRSCGGTQLGNKRRVWALERMAVECTAKPMDRSLRISARVVLNRNLQAPSP